jgi:hypothetical protein
MVRSFFCFPRLPTATIDHQAVPPFARCRCPRAHRVWVVASSPDRLPAWWSCWSAVRRVLATKIRAGSLQARVPSHTPAWTARTRDASPHPFPFPVCRFPLSVLRKAAAKVQQRKTDGLTASLHRHEARPLVVGKRGHEPRFTLGTLACYPFRDPFVLASTSYLQYRMFLSSRHHQATASVVDGTRREKAVLGAAKPTRSAHLNTQDCFVQNPVCRSVLGQEDTYPASRRMSFGEAAIGCQGWARGHEVAGRKGGQPIPAAHFHGGSSSLSG